MEKDEFLSMNETEREAFLIEKNNIKLKRIEFTFKNSWKNLTSFHVEFAPTLFFVKQRYYKSVGLVWLGFVITAQINFKGKPITLNN